MRSSTHGTSFNYGHLFYATKGFTLVELLIAMALASIFILTVLAIADSSVQAYRSQERVSGAQQSVRAAMDMMVRDIRMAGYDPMAVSAGPTGGIGFLVATDTKLQFSMDLNADQADSGGIENMTYFYDSGQKRLRQKEGGKAWPQTFIENVSELKYSYFDVNGDPTEDLMAIAVVEVTLTVEDLYVKGNTFQRTLSTRINCRNLWM